MQHHATTLIDLRRKKPTPVYVAAGCGAIHVHWLMYFLNRAADLRLAAACSGRVLIMYHLIRRGTMKNHCDVALLFHLLPIYYIYSRFLKGISSSLCILRWDLCFYWPCFITCDTAICWRGSTRNVVISVHVAVNLAVIMIGSHVPNLCFLLFDVLIKSLQNHPDLDSNTHPAGSRLTYLAPSTTSIDVAAM